MKKLSRIWAVMKKEMTHIIRDKVVFMICFIASISLTTFFGFVYIQEKVTSVPVIIFDQDQSDISRMIITAFKDSEKLKVIGMAENYDEVQKSLDTQKVQMAILIPPNLKHDLKKGVPTEVGVIINGTNIVITNTASSAASQIIQTLSAGITIKTMEGTGISKQKAYNAMTALSFRARVWYNPGASYLQFMLLGLIGTTLQQLALLAIALSFSKERESGTWKNLMLSHVTGFEAILGKFLVYFGIFTMNGMIMYSLATKFFHIPLVGDPLLAIGTIVLFVAAVLVIGMALSSVIKSQVQAIEVSMILAVPSFILSGYSWPVISMPPAIQAASNVFPLTHFLAAMKMEYLMGQNFDVVYPHLYGLAIIIVVGLPITAIFVNKKLIK